MARSWTANLRAGLRLLSVAGVLGLGLGTRQAAAESAPVAIERDRITGEFVAVPAEEALRQIAAATGADVVGTVLEGRQVTVKLDNVPLEVAMQRILATQSFSLVFDGSGGLRRIRLINAPAATPGVPGGTTRVTSSGSPTISSPGQFMAVEVPISTVGPLAEQLGDSGKATMGQLFELAARSDDAGARVAAVDAAMAAIERDGNLQGSIDKMLTGIDDQALATIIRGSAGDRATELVSRVLSRTRRPEFRQRVVNMLRSLRDTQS